MGLFANTLAFRRPTDRDWAEIQPGIKSLLVGIEGIVTDFAQERHGYGLFSFSPETGAQLPPIAEEISKLTGDYVVIAQIVDSDFSLMQLYCNGQMLEESCVGRLYEEYAEICPVGKPNTDLWKSMLIDQEKESEFIEALHGNEIFVEDQLRKLTQLTDLPIFEDAPIGAFEG